MKISNRFYFEYLGPIHWVDLELGQMGKISIIIIVMGIFHRSDHMIL